MASQVENGKAFEYCVAHALQQFHGDGWEITDNSSLTVGRNCFDTRTAKQKAHFRLCADRAITHISEIESLSQFGKKVEIELQTDSKGQEGDVRDLVIRGQNREIGISCKSNHSALKHSRLSASIDFIEKWGISESGCTDHYWNKVKPLFEELKEIRETSNQTRLWSQLSDVPERFYWPLLQAFSDELMVWCSSSNPDNQIAIQNFVHYLIGQSDFYKVIARPKQVEIEGFNLNGSLSLQKMKLPTNIIGIDRVNGGKYSVTVRFDKGFNINFRIHSASSRVEPSLKFDVNFIGRPDKAYFQTLLLKR
jgi:hypothetical protein